MHVRVAKLCSELLVEPPTPCRSDSLFTWFLSHIYKPSCPRRCNLKTHKQAHRYTYKKKGRIFFAVLCWKAKENRRGDFEIQRCPACAPFLSHTHNPQHRATMLRPWYIHTIVRKCCGHPNKVHKKRIAESGKDSQHEAVGTAGPLESFFFLSC